VDAHVGRLAARSPRATRRLEIPHQFLLLRVDGDRGVSAPEQPPDALIQVGELRIAVGMGRALACLPIRLQTVPGVFQQGRHRAIAHRMVLPRQFVRQGRRALARPPQRRFRIAARHRVNQRHQGVEQWRIGLGDRAPSSTGPTNPVGRCRARLRPQLQLSQSGDDGRPRQAGSPGHQAHATPADLARFGGGPLSAAALVHFPNEGAILTPNPSRHLRVGHTDVIAEFVASLNCRHYDFAVP
jgi:hypothetical protein